MAKMRYVNTRIWSDGYVIDLDPIEKLLFLYILTNSHTETCGCYEIPLKIIALETGVDKDMIEKIFLRFEKDKKVVRRGDWVLIVNFLKHQSLNPNMVRGIFRTIEEIPNELAKILKGSEGFKRVHEGFMKGIQPEPEPEPILELEPELNSNKRKAAKPPALTPGDIAKAFFKDEDKQEEISKWIISKGIDREKANEEIRKFVDYWTEPTKSGKQQRWEKEKAFEIRRRLSTWLNRSSRNYSIKPSQQWHIAQ